MILLFPQWQGANRQEPIEQGTKTLEQYYGSKITHRIIMENHAMITSKSINNYSAIYNQTLRCRELIKKEQPKKIYTIGGDCGIELMPVSYLNNRYENLGVIWFDAHADANTPQSSVSKNFHGMPLRQLCGEGDKELGKLCFSTIDTNQIVYIGLRDVDPPEEEWIKKENIFKSPEADISTIISTLKARNVRNIYLHFDIDVVNPNDYDHALLPIKGGISINQATKTIKKILEEFEIVGTSLTEVIADSQENLESINDILDLLADPIGS